MALSNGTKVNTKKLFSSSFFLFLLWKRKKAIFQPHIDVSGMNFFALFTQKIYLHGIQTYVKKCIIYRTHTCIVC